MRLPVEYYILTEMKFRELIDKQQKAAQVAKQELLAIDPANFLADEHSALFDNKPEFIIAAKIKKYFNEAMFFLDRETQTRLQDLKCNKQLTRWFIPLEQIYEQYEIIRTNQIKIDSTIAFHFTKVYLMSKFNNDMLLQMASTVRDGITITQLTHELIKLKNRRNYSNSDPKRYKDAFEYMLNQMVRDYERIPDSIGDKFDNQIDIFNLETFITLSKGRSESIVLKLLVEECFDYDKSKITQQKFLGIIYDLIRLLMQDRNLPDEKIFNLHDRYSSYRHFSSYKAQILKKIIYLKGRNR